MSADAIPCRFCGSALVAHGLWEDRYMAVACASCGARGPTTKTPVPEPCANIHRWINEAVAAWNRRAPTDAEERGRLKGIEQAASLMDRLSRGSVEGGLLERGVGVVLRSAGGQLATRIRALAGEDSRG